MSDTTGFVLYEVRLGLASETRLVRVRAIGPEYAVREVCDQFPGWHFLEVRQWHGEGWVAVAVDS
jgi:hypothetical protein